MAEPRKVSVALSPSRQQAIPKVDTAVEPVAAYRALLLHVQVFISSICAETPEIGAGWSRSPHLTLPL
jgi:hypothetical protein